VQVDAVRPCYLPTPVLFKRLAICFCLQDDKFFQLEYQLKDNLGAICAAHMALCDQRIDGPNDPDCLRLAQQAADAANFAKTGFPVVLTEDLRPQAYPDFMQKPGKESYESHKALGDGFFVRGALSKTAKEWVEVGWRREKCPVLSTCFWSLIVSFHPVRDCISAKQSAHGSPKNNFLQRTFALTLLIVISWSSDLKMPERLLTSLLC
jgi:hypothetical protein